MEALRREFRVAHEDGMAALVNSDYDALGDAIQRERKIIVRQKNLIEKRTRDWALGRSR
jgi:hypothetical protein